MITLFLDQGIAEGAEIELPDSAAHHLRVRRAQQGDSVRLLDGRGAVATGSVAVIDKRVATVVVHDVQSSPRPVDLVALVPVADRDRMLWAAEKCAELQITAWQPVIYERSRSVAPRGEGDKFAAKVRLRMESALEQSAGAWLPEVKPEIDAADAWREVQAATRLILQRGGAPVTERISRGTVAFAVGPEGGFEKDEIEDALRQGWSSVSLGHATLRFETAIVAAAAVIRATQL